MTVYQIATIRKGFLHQAESHSNVFTLEYGQEMRIEKMNQTVRVLYGTLWISEEGHDIILKHGDSFHLEQVGYPAIVSSADDNAVKFEILN